VLAAGFFARTALPGRDTGLAVRILTLDFAPLGLSVAMAVVCLMPVGLSPRSCRGGVAAAQEIRQWQNGQQADEAAAGASGSNDAREAVERTTFHAKALRNTSDVRRATMDCFRARKDSRGPIT
jgi:hypothetical protein